MNVDDHEWRVRLQVADEHIERVESTVQEFLATDPYEVRADVELLSTSPVVHELLAALGGQAAYDIVFRGQVNAQPPARLAHYVGDAVENLRSAIEILVFTLAQQQHVELSEAQERSVGFPVKSSSGMFNRNRDSIKLLDPAAQMVIRDLQPYQGVEESVIDSAAPAVPPIIAQHPLFMLDRMRQQNFHRSPLLAAATGDVPEFGIREGRGIGFTVNPAGTPARPAVFDTGDEFHRIRVQPRRSDHVIDVVPTVTYDVAFASDGPGQGLPVLRALSQMRAHVADVIFPALERFLAA